VDLIGWGTVRIDRIAARQVASLALPFLWVKRHVLLTVMIGALVCGGLLEAVEAPAASQRVSTDPTGAIQNHDKALPAVQRFVVLSTFNADAVLDTQTGLAWERSPQMTTVRWSVARRICIEKSVGGQKGWRLPSMTELRSLVDPSVAPPGPTLPSGHPFKAVQPAVYWTETRVGEDPTGAWAVHFGLGGGAVFINWAHAVQVWCVHGGIQVDRH
jgi:Protein of unknown function (DUF1566)